MPAEPLASSLWELIKLLPVKSGVVLASRGGGVVLLDLGRGVVIENRRFEGVDAATQPWPLVLPSAVLWLTVA
jgi:hypothetical protein